MKFFNNSSFSIFHIILLLTTNVVVDFVAASNSVNPTSDKHYWPWPNKNYCFPIWPFSDCDDQPEHKPTLAPPTSLPPPPPSPPLLPPLGPSILPPIPSVLPFLDQRLAIVYPVIQNFKNIITSDPLGITKTWIGPNICTYKGFFCDTPPNNASATAVASIDFNGYGLSAPTLDGFLDQLPDLAIFHANSNNFSGTISSKIAKLPFLYELDLSNNMFTGPFPLAVVGMDSLSFLDIRFNLFSGSVPPAIFTQNLDILFLNNNLFLSTLPPSLANTHISYLTLANNKLTGPLPRDIAKALSMLTEVLLMNNDLTGCLPYELGFLNQVTVLDVSHNKLIGPLPFSLACLERVALLDLSANLLDGMVPDMICQLPNLAKLSFSDNYFTQVGPVCRNLIDNGVLDMTNNCVPGLPNQRSVLDCSAFFAVPKICPYMDTYKVIPCKPHFR